MKDKICLNRKIKTILKKVEIKNDYLIPDIKPDVVNIINTNGMVYLIKEQIENGKIKIEGNIENYIIYLGSDGENRSISNTVNFFEVIEDERINENVIADVKAMIINMEAKVLNERKVSLNIYLVLKVELAEESEIEILTSIDGNDKQKLEKNLKVKNILSRKCVNNSLNDVLKINDELKITEIFKVDIEVALKETKMSFNKLLAKSDINIKVLYLDENKNVKMIIGTFPLMTFVETENISDEYYTDFEYIVRNVFFKIQNEGNLVEFQIDFEVRTVIYEEKEINLIEDIYSLSKKLKVEAEDVSIELIKKEDNCIKIDENYKIENISNILGYDVNYKIIEKKKVNDIYNYECEADVTLFYEINEEKILKINIIKIPFMYKLKEDINIEDIEFRSKEIKVNLIGENVNIYIEVENKMDLNSKKQIKIIKDVIEDGDIDDIEYNLIVYFVKKGDSLWSIAKKFNVSFEELMKINNIEKDEKIDIGRKIYIMR